MKIAVLSNTAWYIYNFRLTLIRRLISEGHEVFVFSPKDKYFDRLECEGVVCVDIAMSRLGVNVVKEVRAPLGIRRALTRESVDLVLSYTPKANIYTAVAVIGSPVVQFANISGLGRVFSKMSVGTYFVSLLYRALFRGVERVFFQNREDMRFFIRRKFLPRDKARYVPGSGVDLKRFKRQSRPREVSGDRMVFIMVARLIVEKGVRDYIDAARLIKQKYPMVEFKLLGAMEGGLHGIRKKCIERWEQEGLVEYLGATDKVAHILERVDCVVLPSYYREGVPRSLLEAASMELPVITSTGVGCRDAVDDRVTGFLCPPKKPSLLAQKMEGVIAMDVSARLDMGRKARDKMKREFDERIVLDEYLKEIALLEGRLGSARSVSVVD